MSKLLSLLKIFGCKQTTQFFYTYSCLGRRFYNIGIILQTREREKRGGGRGGREKKLLNMEAIVLSHPQGAVMSEAFIAE